jgi:hypothetical protein
MDAPDQCCSPRLMISLLFYPSSSNTNRKFKALLALLGCVLALNSCVERVLLLRWRIHRIFTLRWAGSHGSMQP